MDVCEHCGSIFLPGRAALVLVELEDRYGIWHQWLCSTCVDDLAQLVHDHGTFVTRVALFGFDLPRLRARSS